MVQSSVVCLQCSGIKKWCLWVRTYVREYIRMYQIFMLLISFQAANDNHLKSREVAVRVTMYVFNYRNQCFYSTSVHCFLHLLALRARVGARAKVTKNDLGKVSREKNIYFSYTVLVSRATLGSRAKVTKNDLGKV